MVFYQIILRAVAEQIYAQLILVLSVTRQQANVLLKNVKLPMERLQIQRHAHVELPNVRYLLVCIAIQSKINVGTLNVLKEHHLVRTALIIWMIFFVSGPLLGQIGVVISKVTEPQMAHIHYQGHCVIFQHQ